MRVKTLMAKLSELDPEDDVYFMDSEYGPEPVEQLTQERTTVKSAGGRQLPKMVWCVE